MQSRLEIRVLGGLTVQHENTPIAFETQKEAVLLVYLAYTGHAHPREVVAEMLWENRTQSQALANLRHVLAQLRQHVAPFVTISRQSVAINAVSDWWLDVTAFENQLNAAEDQDIETLEAAIDLYRGDFLAGVYVDSTAFEDWMRLERERLRFRAMEALDILTAHYLNRRDHAKGIACATQLLQMDNLREETYQQLIQLLAQAGQRAQALAQYETCRHVLEEELGVVPLPETTALANRIQRGKVMVAPDDAEDVRPVEIGDIVANPYKGLRAFEEADATEFFGREALTERLLASLASDTDWARFLAVVGPSGSGKSSVVQAGVIPALRQGAIPGSAHWLIASMLPGLHPFDEFEIMLTRAIPTAPPNAMEHLRRDEGGLLRAVRMCLPDDAAEMLIVIDQFEELFTLVDDPAETRSFIDSLYVATTTLRSPVRILITLRADFYDRPLLIPNFSELLRQRNEVIVPMTPEELEQAVVSPAEQVGVRLEPGLVTEIVAEVSQQPGALPMMEYALTELFDQRVDHTLTLESYRAIGGASGALARRADDVYERLSADRQEAARQLFLRLVTLGEGTEDTRRRTRQAELLSVGGNAMQAALHAFGRSRLLTFDHEPLTHQPRVELAHEAIIREWDRLRGWLDDNRQNIRQQRLLASAAAEWRDADREHSYLLRGSRLEQFEDWAADTDLALAEPEHAFLKASITERERREAQEIARVENELRLERRSQSLLRGLVAVFAVAAVIAIGLAVFGLNQSSIASNERDNAQAARDEAQIAHATSEANAEIALRRANELQNLLLGNAALDAFENGDTEMALSLAIEAANSENPPAEIMTILEKTALGPGTRLVLDGHTMPLISYDISTDGRYALTASTETSQAYYTAQGDEGFYNFFLKPWEREPDMSVLMWDLTTGEEIRRFDGHSEMPDQSRVVRFGQDEKTVISAACFELTMVDGAVPTCQTTEIIVWDNETGEEIRREKLPNILIDPTTADSSLHVLFLRDNRMWVGDLEALDSTAVALPPDLLCLKCVAFSADEETVYVGSPAASNAFDTATGEPIGDFYNFGKLPVNPVMLKSGTRAIGIDSSGQQANLLDLESGDVLQTFEHDGHSLNRVVASKEMNLVIAAFDDTPPLGGRLGLWNLESGEFLGYMSGHSAPIWGMEILPSAELLTISVDNTARIWDLRSAPVTQPYDGHPTRVREVSYSPDGKLAASSTQDSIHIWDVQTRETLNTLLGPRSQNQAFFPFRVKFSPDGKTILGTHCGNYQPASGVCSEATAILWDVATGEEIHRFGSRDYLNDAIFTPDGHSVLLVGCAELNRTCASPEVSLWDVVSGEEIRRYDVPAWTNAAAFHADGKSFYTASDYPYIQQWDTATGDEIRHFERKYWSYIIALNPDETILASRSDTATGETAIYIWDVESGQVVRRLEGRHGAGVNDLVFTQNGRLLSSSDDGTVILWDVESGGIIRTYMGHTGQVLGLAVAPDGNTFLSTSSDTTVREWFLNRQAIIRWVEENRYIRPLTLEERAQLGLQVRGE